MMLSRRDAMTGAAAGMMLAAASARAAKPKTKPLVFAHRGCSALRPEHSLAAYAKAIADGADYIEPDLVATRDGVLVARHENNIAETTDVANRPEFAGRKTQKTIDGQTVSGWFTEDFTLTELKTLRLIERLGKLRPESQGYDGQFQILTFDEIIDFTAAEAAARGRDIGLVPELKHSTYFSSIGLPLEDRFLGILAAHAYTRRAPVEVQSFETANLRYLRGKLGRPANVKLMQLVADGRHTATALREIAGYADVFAPPVRAVIPLDADNKLGTPTRIVADAHAAGLLVRLWTFRPENHFLAADFRNSAGDAARNPAGSIAEMRRYLATGIDGLFTDDPALGRAAVDTMR